MQNKWLVIRDRVRKINTQLTQRFSGQYLLVCVNTGRYALGDPKLDGQGGQKHASDEFDRRYGTMESSGEKWREFLGLRLGGSN